MLVTHVLARFIQLLLVLHLGYGNLHLGYGKTPVIIAPKQMFSASIYATLFKTGSLFLGNTNATGHRINNTPVNYATLSIE